MKNKSNKAIPQTGDIDYQKISKILPSGYQTELAEKYKVTKSYINRIVNGKSNHPVIFSEVLQKAQEMQKLINENNKIAQEIAKY